MVHFGLRCVAAALAIVLSGCYGYEDDDPEPPTAGPENVGTIESALTLPPFAPIADAYVQSPSPDTNYGTFNQLGVGTTHRSFLKFKVTGATGRVTNAKLRLYVTDGSSDGPAVYAAANDGWTESGITWNQQPGRTPHYSGPLLDDKGALPASAYAEWNVTRQVTGDGIYSFMLAGSAWMWVPSREHATLPKPELVVTTTGETTVTTAPNSGTTDTAIKELGGLPDGGATFAEVVGTSGARSSVLLRFDVTSLATTRRIASAKISLRTHLSDTSLETFNVYEVERSWDEATATWTQYGAGAWQSAGAAGNDDRDQVRVGTIQPTLGNWNDVVLNAAGIEMIERWIATPAKNYGIVIESPAGAIDGYKFKTSEGGAYPELRIDVFPVCNDTSMETSAKLEAEEIGHPTAATAPEGFYDETYGTKIIRLTNDNVESYNSYSYWSAFNVDSTRFMIYQNDTPADPYAGVWKIYRFNATDKQNDLPFFGGAVLPPPAGNPCQAEEATWSHKEPNHIYCTANEIPMGLTRNMRVRKYLVTDSATEELGSESFDIPVPPGGWLLNEHLIGQMFVSDDDDVFAFKTKSSGGITYRAGAYRRTTNQLLWLDEKNYTDKCFDEAQLDKGGRYMDVIYTECTGDADCDDGFTCNATGTCECNDNADCGTGGVCSGGLCQCPDATTCRRGESCRSVGGDAGPTGTCGCDEGGDKLANPPVPAAPIGSCQCSSPFRRDQIKLSEDMVHTFIDSAADKADGHNAPGRGHSWQHDIYPTWSGVAYRDFSTEEVWTPFSFPEGSGFHTLHLSHNANDQRWFAFTTFADGSNSSFDKLEDELIAADSVITSSTDQVNWIKRLAQHHSEYHDYRDAPKLSLSYDGKYGVFTSNYFGGRRGAYIIRMPTMCQ